MKLFYRRVEVEGAHYLPARGPVILVANHPNSVTDAYLLATRLTRRRVHFIAKDSITSAPVVGRFVRELGVIGVARAMDYGSRRDQAAARNRAALSACVPLLAPGGVMAIFGEGISTDARRLHAIRKGAMRFGYAAEQAADFKLGVVWAPVGISYSAKNRPRSDVFIRVGQPFRLADLHASPADHERDVIQAGTARLQAEIESLVVNVEHQELAPLIDRLSTALASGEPEFAGQVKAGQELARAIAYFNVAEPQRVIRLQRDVRAFDRKLAATGLTEAALAQRRPWRAFAGGLAALGGHGLLLLLDTYGWANTIVPRWAGRLAAPLGRDRIRAEGAASDAAQVQVAREALTATLGAWAGAAVAFPLQTWLVFRWLAPRYGWLVAGAVAGIYLATLIPAWWLFVRRRDHFRRALASTRDTLRLLGRGRPAHKLRRERVRLRRHVRALLSAYSAQSPR